MAVEDVYNVNGSPLFAHFAFEDGESKKQVQQSICESICMLQHTCARAKWRYKSLRGLTWFQIWSNCIDHEQKCQDWVLLNLSLGLFLLPKSCQSKRWCDRVEIILVEWKCCGEGDAKRLVTRRFEKQALYHLFGQQCIYAGEWQPPPSPPPWWSWSL